MSIIRAPRPPSPRSPIISIMCGIVAGIDHVGIGADYDGTDQLPDRLEDVSCYPALVAELLDRGWSEDDCARLSGGNILRVLREAEHASRVLTAQRASSLTKG